MHNLDASQTFGEI